MKAAAADGPIVIVNVSKYSCNALIVEETSIQSMQLSRLQYDDVRSCAKTLANPESLELDLLDWLWEAIAGPILETLGLLQVPTTDWPRICWIPTGLFVRFLLYAAGRHDGSSYAVLDRVISFYSTSVKALIYSQRNRRKISETSVLESIVLVGMERTPGYSRLPFVSQEVERLEGLYKSTKLRVSRPRPFRQDVLTVVRDCEIFHFAGHGFSDLNDPSRSSLLLSDEPLTVASLFETNLYSRKPFLAYLSACGTGQVRHDGLLDEGLHLIGACQLAGFQHVVGTLWEVNDESCVEVTMATYEWIQKHGISDAVVSEGLYRACREMRDSAVQMALRRGKRRPTGLEQSGSSLSNTREARDAKAHVDLPLYWVPYVHLR